MDSRGEAKDLLVKIIEDQVAILESGGG